MNKLAGLSMYLSSDNKSIVGEYTESVDNRENVRIACLFSGFCQCTYIILVDRGAHPCGQRDGAY
jgi:hypothetical protein